MPTKKPAASRKAAVKPATAVTPAKTTSNPSPARHVWTLPIAMLMLIVAAGGLWLAVRESSNAPQAATPSAVHATAAPEPAAAPARKITPAAASAGPTGTASAAQNKPVSITGCLQHAGDGFVLKNAEGAAVSKTRSWKSGFLRRSSPSVDLLDAGNDARLASHVGQRVAVTGPLAGGEMQVQSLRRLAASCQ